MKKELLLLTLSLLFVFQLFAQEVIFEENFDGLSAGNKIVQSLNNPQLWDTWSSAPGGSEDAVISNKFAFSPDNSLYLANNNDIVLLFNDLTEGRYQIKFKVLIEAGKIGYFNLLHNFAGSNSEWAFQAYFNPNGSGTVDAAGSDAASFSYEYETWLDVNVIVDLNDDFATFYLDDVEIVSWKYSLGSFGSGTLTKLDAVNFYGNTTGGSSGMYVDNLIFSSQAVPEAPLNLSATIENEREVHLSWTAPMAEPDNYVLIKNNEIIKNDLTTNTYMEAPYPGTSKYTVKAHTTGLGYSYGSNEAIVDLVGGKDREFVLFEIGTGTGCPYCPGASMGAVDMVENGDDVIIVKYHNFNTDDPFNNPASAERAANYYKISGYPTSFADGTYSINGGNATNSLFEGYHQHYLQRKERKSLYNIDVNVFHLSGLDYRAEITVSEDFIFNTEEKTLHTALTESDIDYAWQNQDQVHWTCRNMFPNAFGTKIDFSAAENHSLNIDFSLEEGYVKDHCEFVVFLQADPSKEVMVATKVDMADILLNEERFINHDFEIYPNPVDKMIHFNQSMSSDYQIVDLNGKSVQDGFCTDRIDVSNLAKGIYFLKMKGYQIRKISIF